LLLLLLLLLEQWDASLLQHLPHCTIRDGFTCSM
jgi:hypothetical protein